MTWQPIETAPTGAIVVWDGFSITAALHEPDGRWIALGDDYALAAHEMRAPFTHWARLPWLPPHIKLP